MPNSFIQLQKSCKTASTLIIALTLLVILNLTISEAHGAVNNVYVYNGEFSWYDSLCKGYALQELGLLKSGKPNMSAEFEIKNAGGNVIGYKSPDGTKEAYDLRATSLTTAYQRLVNTAGGLLFICVHGEGHEDFDESPPKHHAGGVIRLDNFDQFTGFGKGTGARLRGKIGAYPLGQAPKGNLNPPLEVHLHACYSASDPDGAGKPEISVKDSLKKFLGASGKVLGNPAIARMAIDVAISCGAGDQQSATEDALSEQFKKDKASDVESWLKAKAQDFSKHFAELDKLIPADAKKAGVRIEITYSAIETDAQAISLGSGEARDEQCGCTAGNCNEPSISQEPEIPGLPGLDLNRNCLFENPEFFNALDSWISGVVSNELFFEVTDLWISNAQIPSCRPASGGPPAAPPSSSCPAGPRLSFVQQGVPASGSIFEQGAFRLGVAFQQAVSIPDGTSFDVEISSDDFQVVDLGGGAFRGPIDGPFNRIGDSHLQGNGFMRTGTNFPSQFEFFHFEVKPGSDPSSSSGNVSVSVRISPQGCPAVTGRASINVRFQGAMQAASISSLLADLKNSGIKSGRLFILDQSGRLLLSLKFDSHNSLTTRDLRISGRPLANGVYFYQVFSKDADGRVVLSQKKRLLVIR